jgi:hypothetical protein
MSPHMTVERLHISDESVRKKVVLRYTERLEPVDEWPWIIATVDGVPDAAWQLSASFIVDRVHHVARLKRLEIKSSDDHLEREDEIDSSLLRNLRLVTDLRRLVEREMVASQSGDQRPHLLAPSVLRTGRPSRWTDHELARLAKRYVELPDRASKTDPRSTYEILGEEYNLEMDSIPGLIRRARKAGVLTPTRRGAKGGALTEYAQKLLEESNDGTR